MHIRETTEGPDLYRNPSVNTATGDTLFGMQQVIHLARSRMALSTHAPSSLVIILSPNTLQHSCTHRAAR